MYKKVITKDCPSCNLLSIDEHYNFICSWGKSKKKKKLENKKRNKKCSLIGKE